MNQLLAGLSHGPTKAEVPGNQRATGLEERFVCVTAFNIGQALATPRWKLIVKGFGLLLIRTGAWVKGQLLTAIRKRC